VEKMLAIGQLAGGIAHDFNNQLLGMICYVDLLREEVDNNPLMHEYIDHIYNITERASDLVKQLLSFSRKEKDLCVPWAFIKYSKKYSRFWNTLLVSVLLLSSSRMQRNPY